MSFWSQRFNEHPLWQTVATVRSQVNEIKIDPDDRESAEAMDYLGQVIELLELRQSETATERVTPNMLNAADSAVTGWSNELANVVSGAWNPANALGGADGVQDAFASWPVLKPSRYLSGIQSATEAFVARYGEALERVSALDAASTQKLETLVEEQDDLRTKIGEERDRVSELIADLKLRFDEESKALLAEQEASFEAKVQSWASRDHTRAEEAETLSEELREHEKTARSTVHATTAAVVATDYGKYARNKTVAAWICDVVAALVGAAGVAAILFHLFTLNGTADGNVGLSITRLAASLGTLGIAALIGRRGAQHHREARAAKRTDLALRRVGPFVANLPQNEREEITLELTERIFIRGDLDASGDASADHSTSRFARLRSPLRAGGRGKKPAAD